MSKLIVILFGFLAVASCRKKVSENYIYYQPYRKDSSTLVKKDSIKTNSATVDTPEIKPDKFRPANADDKFFIVIASFSVEEYALAMKEEMAQKGFKPEVIEINNDSWKKIAISSYTNFDEATEALALIRQMKGRFSDARIVVK